MPCGPVESHVRCSGCQGATKDFVVWYHRRVRVGTADAQALDAMRPRDWKNVGIALAAIAILVVIAIPNLADGHLIVEGIVIDESGKPIPNAEVVISLLTRARRTRTDAKGKFFVGGLTSPFRREWGVAVTARDRQTFQTTLVSPGSYTVVVVLPMAGSGGRGSIQVQSHAKQGA